MVVRLPQHLLHRHHISQAILLPKNTAGERIGSGDGEEDAMSRFALFGKLLPRTWQKKMAGKVGVLSSESSRGQTLHTYGIARSVFCNGESSQILRGSIFAQAMRLYHTLLVHARTVTSGIDRAIANTGRRAVGSPRRLLDLHVLQKRDPKGLRAQKFRFVGPPGPAYFIHDPPPHSAAGWIPHPPAKSHQRSRTPLAR